MTEWVYPKNERLGQHLKINIIHHINRINGRKKKSSQKKQKKKMAMLSMIRNFQRSKNKREFPHPGKST